MMVIMPIIWYSPVSGSILNTLMATNEDQLATTPHVTVKIIFSLSISTLKNKNKKIVFSSDHIFCNSMFSKNLNNIWRFKVFVLSVPYDVFLK